MAVEPYFLCPRNPHRQEYFRFPNKARKTTIKSDATNYQTKNPITTMVEKTIHHLVANESKVPCEEQR
jgi:hypothetical protein